MGGAPSWSYGPLGLCLVSSIGYHLVLPRIFAFSTFRVIAPSTHALIASGHLTHILTSLIRNEINWIIQQYGFCFEKGKENTLAFTENPWSQSLCHNLNVSKKKGSRV